MLTENRQAKPSRLQTRSLKNFSICTFYTTGTVLKIRIFAKKLLFFLISDVQYSFISKIRTCNNFIQGTGVFSKISLVSITLRPMGVLYSGLFVTKEKGSIKFRFIWGNAKKHLASALFYQARQQKFWAAQKAWGVMPKA